MYNAFFEFEKNPFSAKTDPAFFYRSKQHDTSLRSLMFTVQSRMGLSSLTGEEGTGKTMLLECLRNSLESTQIQCAFLRDSRLSANRFFQAIASELDLRCPGTSAYQVFSALHQFTLEQARKGRTVALIVDDAHNLPADVLTEILHFASLHDDKVKLLQTVLAGRPQLVPVLDALNLERLKQRAILRCHLDPFTAEETQNYITFRLAQAGLPVQTIFPPEVLSEIYLRSRGFAPAIHAMCEGLLLAAFSAGSKVCTLEILDQALNRTHRKQPEVVGVIDRPLLEVASQPEPRALFTALLGLNVVAIETLPPPLPVNGDDTLQLLPGDVRLMLPKWDFALPNGEFFRGSKKLMRLRDGARSAGRNTRNTLVVQPQVLATSIPAAAILRPTLFRAAISAEPHSASKLQRIGPSIRPDHLALAAARSGILARPIDFGRAALQPAHSAAPGISTTLFPLGGPVDPRPVAAELPDGAPARAHAGSVALAPSLEPAHPAANFQTAGTIQLPRVPVTPFEAAESEPPSPRINEDSQIQLNLQFPGPPMGADLTAFGESNVPERNRLFSLACNLPPSAPALEKPIQQPGTLLQSLLPHGPVSNLQPVNPRSSWLLLPSWKPVDANTAIAVEPALPEPASVGARRPFPVRRKWLLTLATPILAGLALYGLSPGALPGADALNRRWRRAHQAVLDRAAVALHEDFRTGLDDWMNRGGGRPAWTSDAAGFVHPAALALYRPSLSLADYQMQFVGMIDKKALSWVVRAADFNNYYAVRLSVLKPGPVPAIGVVRYAVVDGKIQNQVTTPLLMSARPDTVYRVSLDVHGDHYALAVQDQPVDSWSERKLTQGGVGFFSDQDAASRITAVQVKRQYDMLGRLCAFLVPTAVASYRTSLDDHAALNLTPETQARSGGRGDLSSSYNPRPPHGTARLNPAFWQVPEINVPNARRCGPASGRVGSVRPKHPSLFSGPSASTNCY
jgi:general secretion pathway protein A